MQFGGTDGIWRYYSTLFQYIVGFMHHRTYVGKRSAPQQCIVVGETFDCLVQLHTDHRKK